MKINIAVVFAIGVLVNVNTALAKDKIACSFYESNSSSNSSSSSCLISKQQANDNGNNLLITRKIDLQPILKSFKKLLAKQLNKKDCEKKVLVKSANLNLTDQTFDVNLRARLTRGYCTRRARQQVFEKTNSLSYSFALIVSPSEIKFIDSSVSDKQKSYEKSYTDVLDMNVRKKLNLVLNELLELDLALLSFDSEIVDVKTITYKSTKIDKNSNSLLVEMTASAK